MPNSWIDSVKQTHQLTFYLSAVSGQWLTAVHDAVREFNTVSAQHNLGVTYARPIRRQRILEGRISTSPPPTARDVQLLGSHQTTVNGQYRFMPPILFWRPAGKIGRLWR